MDLILLILITTFIVAIISVVLVLNLIQNHKSSKVKKQLDELEIEKNEINSMPIVPELAKLESFLKNEKLESMYTEWKNRLNDIKDNRIPKITDMIIETDFVLGQKDYKAVLYKLAKLEM